MRAGEKVRGEEGGEMQRCDAMGWNREGDEEDIRVREVGVKAEEGV